MAHNRTRAIFEAALEHAQSCFCQDLRKATSEYTAQTTKSLNIVKILFSFIMIHENLNHKNKVTIK